MLGRIMIIAAVCLVQSACFNFKANAQTGFVLLDDFDEVYQYLDKDDAKVKVAAGTYKLDRQADEPIIAFTGNRSYFDLTGVRLVADRPCNTIIGIIGDNIVLEGLHLETNKSVERCKSGLGTLGVNITGNNNTLRNVTVLIQDSYPYGYGSMFGISGRDSSVKLSKAAGIRVGPGDNAAILDCKVIMRAFGHGIFIRGADNLLIEGAVVEGELRSTDEILMQKSGTAFEQGFLQFTGEIIRPGRITSLQEDGIRIYPDSGTKRNYDSANNRLTGKVTLKDCTVKRMRRGICLALGGDNHKVINCAVIESTRVGFNIGSNTILENCRGDAKYCQLLDVPHSSSKQSNIELEVLDSRERQINSFENDPQLLAKINGVKHKLSITAQQPAFVPECMTIEIGGDVGWAAGGGEASAKEIRLSNKTAGWVLLHPGASDCAVDSESAVVDYGEKNNTVLIRR